MQFQSSAIVNEKLDVNFSQRSSTCQCGSDKNLTEVGLWDYIAKGNNKMGVKTILGTLTRIAMGTFIYLSASK